MKKKTLYITALAGLMGMVSCQDTFLNLEPLDSKTDVVYFQTPEQFGEYSLGLYNQLIGWQCRYGSIWEHFDCSTDLSTYFNYNSDLGFGRIMVGTNDGYWDNCYANIRAVNMLFQKAGGYDGAQEDIAQPLGEGYFFRAYSYFWLLQRFGGVPIVTTVLDVDSPELRSARNTRYEVFDLILSDLDQAIALLPAEANVPATEKGRVTSGGAKAFKARVLLYEATWRKYNGTEKDVDPSAGGNQVTSDVINAYLDESIRLSQDVMGDASYSLWNYNGVSAMQNESSYYLFNIEDESSNPAGMGKDTNHEFIIYSVYDRTYRPSSLELNTTLNYMTPSRKLIDMFVCENGLPTYYNGQKNTQFQGYENPGDEFKNRDYRLKSYIGTPSEDTKLTGGSAGYYPKKFVVGRNATNKDFAPNYPVLRLAEVYLIYAEALYERYGSITDDQLNQSINKLRSRAGVDPLTNALVDNNGLNMLDEIRRERTVELYMEGFRFDDLKRWGILEDELNESRCGMVVGEDGYDTYYKKDGEAVSGNYTPNVYVWGEESVPCGDGQNHNAVVIGSKSDISVSETDYLYPIPQRQIDLNPNLVQNPGY